MTAPARGEIWSVHLDPVLGHEQGGTRPCLILSVNRFNEGRADLVVVLPVTSRFKGIASHVKIAAGEAALTADSYIKCEEVRCVSKQRLMRRWGAVEGVTMRSVEQFVRLILGLQQC